MEDLITVIINVYNGEKFIKKCLDCIINQTYKNLEILIINDGSIDGTLKICESYSDKRIRIINQKNMGLSLSRNVGIDNAKGEWLFFVDVDDWIDLDTIEYLYKLCKEKNTLISTCKSMVVLDDNYIKEKNDEKVEVISNIQMLKRVLIYGDVQIWNKLIKKELFKNARFEDRIINDVVVTYKLVLATDKIAYGNQIKYYYLQHESSITKLNNEDRSIDVYNATLERYYNIKKLYPDLIENEIAAMREITFLSLHSNKKVKRFLKEQKTTKLVRKMFSLKILKIKFESKIKMSIILYVISPTMYKFFIKTCMKFIPQYKMYKF